LSVGKATATSIDLPFQVIGISQKRVWIEAQDRIQALQTQISKVNDTLGKLITSIPDVGVSDEKLTSHIFPSLAIICASAVM
jgi:hypothetical protein